MLIICSHENSIYHLFFTHNVSVLSLYFYLLYFIYISTEFVLFSPIFFVAQHPIITSCEESYKTGTHVYVHFHDIKHTCTCSVMPAFTGKLMVQVKWSSAHLYLCNSKVTVDSNIAFMCTTDSPQSTIVNVQANNADEAFTVDNTAHFTSGFYPCILLKQNGTSIKDIFM